MLYQQFLEGNIRKHFHSVLCFFVSLLVSEQFNNKQITTEIKKPDPDVSLVRRACLACGVPSNQRGRVWEVLLRCVNAPEVKDSSGVNIEAGSQSFAVCLFVFLVAVVIDWLRLLFLLLNRRRATQIGSC